MSVNIQVKRSNTANKRPDPALLAFGELAMNYNAGSTGLFFAADNGSLIKVGPATVSGTAPNATPAGFAGNSIGEFWFDTTATTLKLWDGAAWVEAGGSVQGVTGTAPINVNNTDPLNPVISISAASTSTSGAVQLTDSTSSTSTTTAATPNSVKNAFELAAAAMPKTGGDFTGIVTFTPSSSLLLNALTTVSGGNQILFEGGSGSGAYFEAGSYIQMDGDIYVGAGGSFTTYAGSFITLQADTSVSGVMTFSTSPVYDPGVSAAGAYQITYDNTTSGLAATEVQGAIDEVATSFVPNSSFAASGDILVGTGSGTYSALAAGSADYVLTSDGAGALQWVQQVAGNVVSVSAAPGSPITVDNVDPQNPVIDITASSTAAAGAVQLEDSVTSTSDTLALTANQGYLLQQQINALVASGLTLAGTYDANTGFVISPTAAGTAAGFTTGAVLPAPSTGNTNYFVIVEVPGTNGPNSPTLASVGDWFLSDGSAWVYLNVGYDVPSASTTTAGIVRLATTTETQTGTDGTIAITPSGAAATYVPYSTFTTLGQLVVGTGVGTVGTLAAGGDGEFLIADSGAPLGLSYTNAVDGGTY
jgi:hypothetical protein